MRIFPLGAVLAVVLTQSLLALGGPSASGEPAARTAGRATACSRPAKGFVPDRASIPAIGRTVRVIQVRRTSNGAVGAGPVTEEGKFLMAMDPHTKPGGHKGTVILSGHTWPDGSALGNAMLAHLHEGDGIMLANSHGRRACYRVSERTSYPANQVPSKKAFRYWGPEQVTIVSCSGKRLGPGNWTRRTVWYATPYAPARPPKPSSHPHPTPAPQQNQSNGTLLGGLLGILG